MAVSLKLLPSLVLACGLDDGDLGAVVHDLRFQLVELFPGHAVFVLLGLLRDHLVELVIYLAHP